MMNPKEKAADGRISRASVVDSMSIYK